MFQNRTILVVEDEPIVGLDLTDAVGGLGAQVIGPIQTAFHALAILAERDVDGAILDAMLPDGDVTPVGLVLLERGIPFIIHTGTGAPAELAAAGPHIPVVLKPVPPGLLAERLAREMGQRPVMRLSMPDPEG